MLQVDHNKQFNQRRARPCKGASAAIHTGASQPAAPAMSNNICTHMLEQGGDPVQLEHMLLPHVALQLLNALMRLQVPDGSVTGSNGRGHRALQASTDSTY